MAYFNRFNGCHRLEIPSYNPLISVLIVLLTMKIHHSRLGGGRQGALVLLTTRSNPQLLDWCLAHTPMTEAITTLGSGTPFPQAQTSRSHWDFSTFPYSIVHFPKIIWVFSPPDSHSCRDPGGWQRLTSSVPQGAIKREFFKRCAKGLNLATGIQEFLKICDTRKPAPDGNNCRRKSSDWRSEGARQEIR